MRPRGSRAKTHGLWIDDGGNEHALISGEHDEEYREAVEHGRRLELVPEPGTLDIAGHVEVKFAMHMRRTGVSHATIIVNNAPCEGRMSCDQLLARFLPLGATLTVYGPNDFKETYRGEDE